MNIEMFLGSIHELGSLCVKLDKVVATKKYLHSTENN